MPETVVIILDKGRTLKISTFMESTFYGLLEVARRVNLEHERKEDLMIHPSVWARGGCILEWGWVLSGKLCFGAFVRYRGWDAQLGVWSTLDKRHLGGDQGHHKKNGIHTGAQLVAKCTLGPSGQLCQTFLAVFLRNFALLRRAILFTWELLLLRCPGSRVWYMLKQQKWLGAVHTWRRGPG